MAILHSPQYSSDQTRIIKLPIGSKTFLEGPAGVGKTTIGVERMLHLMDTGVSGNTILVLVPQRTLGTPYIQAMNLPGVVAGGMVSVLTHSGLAQRMVDLFWPLVAGPAGFARPEEQPVFLTLETAQYYMAHLVRPLLGQGYFASLTMDRNRLYSQIIDNLNKAAVVGFPCQEIGDRLKTAWSGEPGQSKVYEEAQACAALFRGYCLQNNLLDFSLQIELFWQHLWKSELCQQFLIRSFRHLIVDNIEEDVPITHDLLADWIPQAESSLVIYDSQAGYRRFLGADPVSAYHIKELCDQNFSLTTSFVPSQEIQSLSVYLRGALARNPAPKPKIDPRPAIVHETHTYYPQMLDWIAAQISQLIDDEGIAPQNIAVLAPFLSDSLRFSIVNRLANRGIPVKTHRPSRSLREEPATFCLVTFAVLAHPAWGIIPTKFDVAHSLMQAIAGMDLIRAKLLTDIVFRIRAGIPTLSPFEQIIPTTQERISYVLGEKYERLRLWLAEYQQASPGELDHFISRLFGEILSQAGYGFHTDYDKGQVAANLVDSIRKFRRVVGNTLLETGVDMGKEYIQMLNDGVIAAQYMPAWKAQTEQAVFIAPAYTFLTNNYPVDVQFWLDIGNRSWSERLYQPLTHPYVLSRNWPGDKTWTDSEEVETGEQVLSSLVYGLLNRCRKRIYLGLSEYNEQGYEQRGPLLQAFHHILQGLAEG
ncbi:MAG: hypothetical protein C3F13_10550 [Anaerolineales bacterium]|nr:hypothetical protein [Anaerolineae bacterium]PWB53049.1 MAG: hypothetical protein C3F13_10550 [Anaerolineales bacterium]